MKSKVKNTVAKNKNSDILPLNCVNMYENASHNYNAFFSCF